VIGLVWSDGCGGTFYGVTPLGRGVGATTSSSSLLEIESYTNPTFPAQQRKGLLLLITAPSNGSLHSLSGQEFAACFGFGMASGIWYCLVSEMDVVVHTTELCLWVEVLERRLPLLVY
jgi:hypothetical protein